MTSTVDSVLGHFSRPRRRRLGFNEDGLRAATFVLPRLQIHPVLRGLKAPLSASNGKNCGDRGPDSRDQSEDQIFA